MSLLRSPAKAKQGPMPLQGAEQPRFESQHSLLQDAGHVEHYAQMQEPLSSQHAKRQRTCVGDGGSTTACTEEAERG